LLKAPLKTGVSRGKAAQTNLQLTAFRRQPIHLRSDFRIHPYLIDYNQGFLESGKPRGGMMHLERWYSAVMKGIRVILVVLAASLSAGLVVVAQGPKTSGSETVARPKKGS